MMGIGRAAARVVGAAMVAAAVGLSACAGPGRQVTPPETVPRVDLARYSGTWYEIARFPNRFEEGCFAPEATYTLLEDGTLEVVNRCRRGSPEGELSSTRGTARVADPATNAKLEVTFFWPFSGDYWIIGLDPEYRWAVVSNPDRRYLWILSRSRRLPEETYRSIVADLARRGFDVERLIRAPQPPE